MALLVLIVLGTTLGWLASILGRTEAARDIIRQIGIGLVVTLIVGLIVNNGTFLGGLTWVALGAGAGAAIVALVIYNLAIKRSVDA